MRASKVIHTVNGHAVGRLLVIAMLLPLLLAIPAASAHNDTKSHFLRANLFTQAQAQREAEPAPQSDQAKEACRLTIKLTIDEQHEPAAGLIRITNVATGRPIAFAGEIARDQLWYAIAGSVTLLVPRTKIRIEAFHGLTTLVATRELDLADKSEGSLSLAVRTFYDPATKNLVAGNTHLHLMKLTRTEAMRYLETVPRADGLDLVFLSYLSRPSEDRDYISNTFTATDLSRLSHDRLLFGNGEEHRNNLGGAFNQGYGHVMFLDILRLIEPVSIGPSIMQTGTDGIPLQRGIRQARADGAAVIWCHNKFGHEDIPNWVEGLIDAQNIFDGGAAGTYDDTFYRYLNLGLRVPFSAGTDWFILDFSRVYVPLAGELTAKRWLAALAKGKSWITNGTFLEFDVAQVSLTAETRTQSHQATRTLQPGETIHARSGEELTITARAIGRSDFKRLELVQNGRVIHSTVAAPKPGYFEATMDRRLRITEPGWIAVRIPTDFPPPRDASSAGTAADPIGGVNELGKPLFAHTSPIYVEMDGRRIFQLEVAERLVAEMQASVKTISEQGTFANSDERETVLSVYRNGIERVRKMIEVSR